MGVELTIFNSTEKIGETGIGRGVINADRAQIDQALRRIKQLAGVVDMTSHECRHLLLFLYDARADKISPDNTLSGLLSEFGVDMTENSIYGAIRWAELECLCPVDGKPCVMTARKARVFGKVSKEFGPKYGVELTAAAYSLLEEADRTGDSQWVQTKDFETNLRNRVLTTVMGLPTGHPHYTAIPPKYLPKKEDDVPVGTVVNVRTGKPAKTSPPKQTGAVSQTNPSVKTDDKPMETILPANRRVEVTIFSPHPAQRQGKTGAPNGGTIIRVLLDGDEDYTAHQPGNVRSLFCECGAPLMAGDEDGFCAVCVVNAEPEEEPENEEEAKWRGDYEQSQSTRDDEYAPEESHQEDAIAYGTGIRTAGPASWEELVPSARLALLEAEHHAVCNLLACTDQVQPQTNLRLGPGGMVALEQLRAAYKALEGQ